MLRGCFTASFTALSGDLVEDHALQLLVLQRLARLEDLGKMPRDRLALAVRVRREHHDIDVLDGLRDGVDVLRVALDQLVLHLEIVVGVHRAGLRHEVAHVAIGSEDLEILAEVFLERFRLRGRLDDEQMRCHGLAGAFCSHFMTRALTRWNHPPARASMRPAISRRERWAASLAALRPVRCAICSMEAGAWPMAPSSGS